MANISPTDIKQLFSRARQIYGQTATQFYISSKSLYGLHMAVLPPRDQYVFSAYNFGNDEDVHTVHKFYQAGKDSFRTFGCTMCPIEEKENAVIVSDIQNQLYIDPNTPAIQLQVGWHSSNNRKYIITATVPQYYYSHLLFTSAAHIPTYNVFLVQDVFEDLYQYLGSVNDDVVALFNGTFGSDVYHFHVHLTNQKFSVIDQIRKIIDTDVANDPSMYNTYNDTAAKNGLVNFYAGASYDWKQVFAAASAIVYEYVVSTALQSAYSLTANMFVHYVSVNTVDSDLPTRKPVYCLVLHKTASRSHGGTARKINGCDYIIFPAGYLLKANCFNALPNPQDYYKFQQDIAAQFLNVYLPWNIDATRAVQAQYSPAIINQNILSKRVSDSTDLDNITAEELGYIVMDQVYRVNTAVLLPALQSLIARLVNCYIQDCKYDYKAKFMMVLGIYISIMSDQQLQTFISSQIHR